MQTCVIGLAASFGSGAPRADRNRADIENAVPSERHRTWTARKPPSSPRLYALAARNDAAVIESYEKARAVARQTQ